MVTPICQGCKKSPEELEEYVEQASAENESLEGMHADEMEEMGLIPFFRYTPTSFVQMEEGTYNPENGHFLCTDCYIAAGMPTAPQGWKCP